jgi:hypothetical protein
MHMSLDKARCVERRMLAYVEGHMHVPHAYAPHDGGFKPPS